MKVLHRFFFLCFFQMNGFSNLVLCTPPSSSERKIRVTNVWQRHSLSGSLKRSLLLSRLLDGRRFVMGDAPELVGRLRPVFVERLYGLWREVSISLGHHPVDRLTILILYRRSREGDLNVRLRWRRSTRQGFLRFMLSNSHSAGFIGWGMASFQHLVAFSMTTETLTSQEQLLTIGRLARITRSFC